MPSTKLSDHKKSMLWQILFPVLLLVFVWTRLTHQSFWLAEKFAFPDILLFLLEVFLSFSLSMFLTRTLTHKKRLDHIAFLASIGIMLTLLILSRPITGISQISLRLFLLGLSAFIGCFLASCLMKGFWENNAPPSSSIEEEVIAGHRQYMGRAIKIRFKRTLDILFSLLSLVLSLPIWLGISFLIWWEDPGPVLFVKNSVGLGGVNFRQLKFRSMIIDAEKDTGPISGYENDERVLLIGKFIRKTALDELPQLINILMGDMSYVGPRPQRTVLVHGYLQDLPEYAARHRVRPGLAGLAQVADSYSISPEEKLAWDLAYINRSNAWFDLKLVLAAFFLVFALRWRPEGHPELTIRKLLKINKPTLSAD